MFGTNKRANAQKIVIGVLAFSVLFALIAACSLEGAVDDIYQQVLNDNPYIVSFDTGTGGDPVPSKTIVKGHLVPEPDQPSNTNGDTFGWWFTDSAKTVPWDFQNDKVSSDMTLYASWDASGTYTVVFFALEGDPPSTVLDTATTPPATTPKKTGYTFDKWVDNSTPPPTQYATYAAALTAAGTATKSMAVYATWIALNATAPVIDPTAST
ncbi:MAG: InlB B-repeat-containing protein, partial [Treponema sp.]|nr:InlB B-repeat-containing protein [Treponema sp.]